MKYETAARVVAFTAFTTIVVACATLIPDNKPTTVGAVTTETYEKCASVVVLDTVIVSAEAVLEAERQGLPVELAGQILRVIAQKEIDALKVCAKGEIPERLWTPTERVENKPHVNPPGTVETDNTPTQRF